MYTLSLTTADSRASSLHAERNPSQLRLDAKEFVPRRSGQRQLQKRLLQAGRLSTTYKLHSKQKTSVAIHEGEELRGIRRQLRSYAIRALTHCSDPEDPGALAEVTCTVTRVPATCFNEQKFEDKEGYKVEYDQRILNVAGVGWEEQYPPPPPNTHTQFECCGGKNNNIGHILLCTVTTSRYFLGLNKVYLHS